MGEHWLKSRSHEKTYYAIFPELPGALEIKALNRLSNTLQLITLIELVSTCQD